MRLSPQAQNIIEWLGLKLGLVPTPIALSHFGFLLSKIILEATEQGIFENIGQGNATVEEIAAACRLNRKATEQTLAVLATMGLVKIRRERISLTRTSKKWLLKDSPHSMYWLMMFDQKVCLKWLDYFPEFLKTGKGLQYHDHFSAEEWFYYQKAMHATASLTSKEVTRKVVLKRKPHRMLDIGGAHGLYAQAFCDQYPGLQATVLDLPAAIEQIDRIGQQAKIEYRKGNILTSDIGTDEYDFILMANVSHHLSEEENISVTEKVHKALKPGGVFSIVEVLRTGGISNKGDMLSATGDFFFSLSSTSGLWTKEQVKLWFKDAGYTTVDSRRFIGLPGLVALSATK